jgi:hypothetical protein
MATTTAKSGGGSKVNRGGTVVGAGTLGSDSPMTKVLNTKDLRTGTEYGSKVKADTSPGPNFYDPHGVITAKASGTGGLSYFPTRDDRNFLIRGAGSTGAGKINNDSSTLLTIPGGVSTDNTINKMLVNHRVGAYSSTSFNVLAVPSSGVSPGRTKGANAGASFSYVATSGNGTVAGTDDAAATSRRVPGELTYMFGAKTPKNMSYKAKDLYES